ncbi:MAG: DUF3050 domain-containing protein [Flavobacteriales bacterium]
MSEYIEKILHTTAETKHQILNHELYRTIRTKDDLGVFMQFHVYAVWDFMSLLKSLQNQLTCVNVPWLPVGDADTRFLINEIVVGEESDVDINGIRKSHFEMYLDAMEQAGADTTSIKSFITSLRNGKSLQEAFDVANTPYAAQQFVQSTFAFINANQAHQLSAVFTFGREELIPGMFVAMINDLHRNFPDEISAFKYYLDRHIEIDGGHHSHLATSMTKNLCGTDLNKWEKATRAVEKALAMRLQLWNGALNAIKSVHLQTA